MEHFQEIRGSRIRVFQGLPPTVGDNQVHDFLVAPARLRSHGREHAVIGFRALIWQMG